MGKSRKISIQKFAIVSKGNKNVASLSGKELNILKKNLCLLVQQDFTVYLKLKKTMDLNLDYIIKNKDLF